jgi:hypothetical protein
MLRRRRHHDKHAPRLAQTGLHRPAGFETGPQPCCSYAPVEPAAAAAARPGAPTRSGTAPPRGHHRAERHRLVWPVPTPTATVVLPLTLGRLPVTMRGWVRGVRGAHTERLRCSRRASGGWLHQLTDRASVHPARCPGIPAELCCSMPRTVSVTCRTVCMHGFDRCSRSAHLDMCRALPTEEVEQQLAWSSGDAGGRSPSPCSKWSERSPLTGAQDLRRAVAARGTTVRE